MAKAVRFVGSRVLSRRFKPCPLPAIQTSLAYQIGRIAPAGQSGTRADCDRLGQFRTATQRGERDGSMPWLDGLPFAQRDALSWRELDLLSPEKRQPRCQLILGKHALKIMSKKYAIHLFTSSR